MPAQSDCCNFSHVTNIPNSDWPESVYEYFMNFSDKQQGRNYTHSQIKPPLQCSILKIQLPKIGHDILVLGLGLDKHMNERVD